MSAVVRNRTMDASWYNSCCPPAAPRLQSTDVALRINCASPPWQWDAFRRLTTTAEAALRPVHRECGDACCTVSNRGHHETDRAQPSSATALQPRLQHGICCCIVAVSV